ncbi:MAG: hypothetical protein AB2A00_15120 [Myxococcota bacterium]
MSLWSHQDAVTGEVECALPAGGDVTGVNAGMGLSSGGADGEISLAVDMSVVQQRVVGDCPAGSAIRAVGADGTVTCEPIPPPGITEVVAGPGLSSGGVGPSVALQVDDAYVQRRIVAECPVGSYVTSVRQDGTVTCAPDAKALFRRTVVVSPVPGDPLASGTALLDALALIADASETNPYVLKVEPGTYELGDASLLMKAYVDIEGSGASATTIIAHGADTSETATVITAPAAELRGLTVANSGGRAYSVALLVGGGSAALRDVVLTASGDAPATTLSAGVQATGPASVALRDVSISVGGRAGTISGVFIEGETVQSSVVNARGLQVTTTSTDPGVSTHAVWLERCSALLHSLRIQSTGTAAYQVGFFASSSDVELRGAEIDVSDGGNTNEALSFAESSARVANFSFKATGAAAKGVVVVATQGEKVTLNSGTILATDSIYGNADGVLVKDSSVGGGQVLVTRTSVAAEGVPPGTNDGIECLDDNVILHVRNSDVEGGAALRNVVGCSLGVGGSRLAGLVAGAGLKTCVASFDANFSPLPAGCQ